MKTRYIAHALFSAAVLLAVGLSSCSYVADYVEAEIMNRASFSIEARYVPGTGVIIEWDETGSSSDFPGFEIYMTDTANDEYAGYIIIGGQYATGEYSLFTQDANLGIATTGSFTLNQARVNTIIGNSVVGLRDLGPGRYFFRVGILSWDKPKKDRTTENGYAEDDSSDYPDHTDLDEISGYAMVEIK